MFYILTPISTKRSATSIVLMPKNRHSTAPEDENELYDESGSTKAGEEEGEEEALGEEEDDEELGGGEDEDEDYEDDTDDEEE